MIFYWSLFALPALVALGEKISLQRRGFHPIVLFLIPLVFIIAFRKTGGDYYTYNLMLLRFGGVPLAEWIQITEPIYGFFNWASYEMGWGLYGVNAACAILFVYCLYKFAMDEPRPLFLVALAVPYLIIVTAIGYTRQGMAVGFFMLGLTFLRRYQPMKYVVCCLLAMGFHSSAALLLPLTYFGFSNKSNQFMRYAKGIAILVFLGVLGLNFTDKVSLYTTAYIESDRYQSDGAFKRSIQNGIAGLIYFIYLKQWGKYFQDQRIYFFIAIVAIISVPASLVYSTAVDRIALYILPFQVLAFSRFPLFQKDIKNRGLLTLAVLIAYAFVLYVWMHKGNFAQVLWLPFDHLFIGLIE